MSVYIAGITPALKYAASELRKKGIQITDSAGWQTEDVLLDVPSFRPGGIRPEEVDTLLASLPRSVKLWGGNLDVSDCRCIDLLKDEGYLWKNAAITARCALKLSTPLLQQPWNDCAVLILGWGRISTYLGKMLQNQGASVTVASRKETDRLRLEALDYRAVDYDSVGQNFDLVINTVPCPMFHQSQFSEQTVLLDLASRKGIDGDRVIWARGLPGIHAPQESGKLIAETFLRLKEVDEQ